MSNDLTPLSATMLVTCVAEYIPIMAVVGVAWSETLVAK